jgi:VanZ family protein
VSDLPPAASVRPILTRRHYAGLTLALALFIVYGSLVPFNYQPLTADQAVARFREVCDAPVRVDSRSDWLANFLLALPLGYLFMGALCAGRGPASCLGALLVLPCCLALSTAVEFAQLWFPPRVSSLNDIVAQFVGAAFGTATWLAFGQRITRWARRVWLTIGTQGLAARLLPGYLALLGLMYGMPFDLTLSPADLYHKWRDGRVRLMPFGAHDTTIFEKVEKYCWTVALFLPMGLLLANVRLGTWQRPGAWWRVLAVALASTLLIQCLKLLVLSRYVDATEVVVGVPAVVAGWGLVLALHRRSRGPWRLRKGFVGLLLLAWAAVAVFVNWQPFTFRFDPGFAAERVRNLSLLPFQDYYWSDYLNAFDQFVHKVLLFAPLGALLTLLLPDTRGRGGLVLLASAAVAAGLEAGQLFLPTRYPSVTDVLVETGGACVGLVLTRRAQVLIGSARPELAARLAGRDETTDAVGLRGSATLRVPN